MKNEYILLIVLTAIVCALYVWNVFVRKKRERYAFVGCLGHYNTTLDDMRVVEETHARSKEELCRRIFERYFHKSNLKFPRARPAFLRNPKTGRNLELDGYNANVINANGDCGLAFEYNGSQHYFYQPKYHNTLKDFEGICERDQLKMDLCRKKGVNLIVIRYDVPRNQIRDYIWQRLYERDYYVYL